MKRIIIVLLMSMATGLTLITVNMKKDPTSANLKMENIEAFGAGENDDNNPCKIVGTMCIYYDENGNPHFLPGLTTEQ